MDPHGFNDDIDDDHTGESVDPLDDPLNECWSCGRLFRDGEGYSLHGTGEEVICRSCWRRIPIWRRIWLGLWFRSMTDGGIGARELFEAALTSSTPFRFPFGPGKN